MPGSLIDPHGHLRATVIKRVIDVMKVKRIKSGDVMAKMSYNKLDPRLGLAIARRWKPAGDFLDRLATFLSASKI